MTLKRTVWGVYGVFSGLETCASQAAFKVLCRSIDGLFTGHNAVHHISLDHWKVLIDRGDGFDSFIRGTQGSARGGTVRRNLSHAIFPSEFRAHRNNLEVL